ncbi:MAG: hypothetical protein DRI90_26070, partial [Deltaproteobacteria bacterium]
MGNSSVFHASLAMMACVSAYGFLSVLGGCGDDDSGLTDPAASECGGHGDLSGDQCVCDDGYRVDPGDASLCIENPG